MDENDKNFDDLNYPLILKDEVNSSLNINSEILKIKDLIQEKYLIDKNSESSTSQINLNKNFSFIVENHISYIFKLFSLNNVKVHITQNSALNFSVCAFISKENIEPLILELSKDFNVIYNENVDLLTIRNHTKSIFPKNLESKEVLLQQQIRGTKRFVLL